MALIELPIYNDDNEIIKTYSTNRVRWGVFVKAVEVEETITKSDSNVTASESMKMISDLILSIFPSMTADDLAAADYNDMKNVFSMVVNFSGHIQSEKNG